MIIENTTTVNVTGSCSNRGTPYETFYWLTVFRVILSFLLLLTTFVNICGILFSEFDKVTKLCTLNLNIAVIFIGLALYPIQLLRSGLDCDQTLDGVSRCYIGLGLQLFVILGFYIGSDVVGLFMWINLERPLSPVKIKPTTLLTLAAAWTFVTLFAVIPTAVFISRQEVELFTRQRACGWWIYPETFIFGTIYGVLLPSFVFGSVGFCRAIRITRRHQRQISAPETRNAMANCKCGIGKSRSGQMVALLITWALMIATPILLLHASNSWEWETDLYFLLLCASVWFNSLLVLQNHTVKAGRQKAWKKLKVKFGELRVKCWP